VEQEADARRSRMTVSIPPIISVDDHVIEPPDLWQRWLPVRFREAGPRVVRGPYEMVPGGEIDRAARSGWNAFRPAADGPETDWWLFEGGLSATLLGNAAAGLPPDEVVPGPITFDCMRPGFYSVKERLADLSLNHTERSLCFPTYPRFAGQRFLETKDKDLACVQAYNDWMIEEWCGDSGGRLIPLCLIPLWDSGLAAAFEDEFGLRSRYDIGVDIITFECDYPHQDSTWPNTLAYAEKILGDLPEEEVFKIVPGNALELFGLEPELAGQAGD
jgi:hypothetical protein